MMRSRQKGDCKALLCEIIDFHSGKEKKQRLNEINSKINKYYK